MKGKVEPEEGKENVWSGDKILRDSYGKCSKTRKWGQNIGKKKGEFKEYGKKW